jgi:hypothetical protein
MGGQPRRALAAINLRDGAAGSWNPRPNGPVAAVAVSTRRVFAGGSFSSLGGQVRHGLAAVDLRGRLLPWAPAPPGPVVMLAAAGGRVFAGTANAPRAPAQRLAAFSITSGEETAFRWTAAPDEQVGAMAATSTTLYIAGSPGKPFVHALDARTGRDLGWRLPLLLRGIEDAVSAVSALAVRAGLLYVGGHFTQIGDARRRNFAAIRRSDQHVTPLRPDPESGVESMAFGPHVIYLAAIELLTIPTAGTAAPRVHLVGDDDTVTQLVSVGGHLYGSGVLTGRSGEGQEVEEFDESTGRATRWNPHLGQTHALAAAPDGTIIVGGAFAAVGGVAQSGLAMFRPRSRR